MSISGKRRRGSGTFYIDGSKFEANANKYSWVWKKQRKIQIPAVSKQKITHVGSINEDLANTGLKVDNTEHPCCLEMILDDSFSKCRIDEKRLSAGRWTNSKDQGEERYYDSWKNNGKTERICEKIRSASGTQQLFQNASWCYVIRGWKDHMGKRPAAPAYNIIGAVD